MDIRLVVLRTGDPQGLADFYSLLGLTFDYHRHGGSPHHYVAPIGQAILEIYPLTKKQVGADTSLRLGFGIENFDQILEKLRQHSVTLLAEPAQTDFGFMAVVADPDGRKIELYSQ
ncbi:MAG: VOC family protein [Janthinobacterium lividum]